MKTLLSSFILLLPLVLAPLSAAEPDARPAGPGPEMRRGPGPGPRGPQGRPPGAASERERVSFLGAAVAPAPAVLGAQLGLPREAGLVVFQVDPRGPAHGVLREHDVLTHLEDQLLVNPQQFAALVRQRAEGTEVTLSVLRAGKKETLKVKLGAREEPRHRPYGGMMQHRFGQPEGTPTPEAGPGPGPGLRRGPGARPFPPREGGPTPPPAPGSGPG
jgi:hypothetical protein